MSGGWIKLWRQIEDHPLWIGHRFSPGQAWLDLLLSANYEHGEVPVGNRLIFLKRGQLVRSQRYLARRWRWARNTVSSFLRHLETASMLSQLLSQELSQGNMVITICNYERYQGSGEDALSQQLSQKLTTELSHNNKEVLKKRKKKEPPVFDEGAFWTKFSSQDQEVIHQVIRALHTTRKGGKVADSIIQAEMRWWDQQEPAKVIEGMQTYLQKGYAAQGKREPYLRGIVRNSDGAGPVQGPAPQERRSPGAEAIRRAAMSMTREDCGEG